MDWEETETIEQHPLPVITVILVLINVGTYLYTEWKGSSLDAEFMIDMGAMYEPAFVEEHEYYRIITHFFRAWIYIGAGYRKNTVFDSVYVIGDPFGICFRICELESW